MDESMEGDLQGKASGGWGGTGGNRGVCDGYEQVLLFRSWLIWITILEAVVCKPTMVASMVGGAQFLLKHPTEKDRKVKVPVPQSLATVRWTLNFFSGLFFPLPSSPVNQMVSACGEGNPQS